MTKIITYKQAVMTTASSAVYSSKTKKLANHILKIMWYYVVQKLII
jgi:hypothetical protein